MTQPNMKFRIKSPDHSTALQEKLFEMKIGWSGDNFTVKRTDRPFLYAEGKYLTFEVNEQAFAENPSTECILTKDGKIVHLVDEDGFIYWEGGDCPVPKGTLVDVKYRDGVRVRAVPAGVSDVQTQRSAYNWEYFDGSNTIVGYKPPEKQPAAEAPSPQEPPASQEQPIPPLRPQKEMWLDRAAELLAAMALCIDNGQKIPYDWIDELSQANDYL